MREKRTATVLVLGATGMLGRIVYKYLKKKHPKYIFGTTRIKSKRFMYLTVNDNKSVNKVLTQVKPDFVVNCIGVLRNGEEKEINTVNVLFPKTLELLSRKLGFKIINISSDAVYSPTSGVVFESSKTNPDGYYSKSKLKGETKVNTLNIRTSLIGFDPKEHKGLIEYALKDIKNTVGYTNQIWTGATTLQVARFIEDLIFGNLHNLLQKTFVVNFAPIKPVTKFQILDTFVTLISKHKIKREVASKHTTELRSNYLDEATIAKYNRDLVTSLKELIKFDKTYAKTFKKS